MSAGLPSGVIAGAATVEGVDPADDPVPALVVEEIMSDPVRVVRVEAPGVTYLGMLVALPDGTEYPLLLSAGAAEALRHALLIGRLPAGSALPDAPSVAAPQDGQAYLTMLDLW